MAYQTKHTGTATAQSKNTSTPTAQTKNTGTWDDGVNYLLQEIGDFLLQENGSKIVLQQSPNFRNPATATAGTKHTGTWAAQSKS
jgi:hypothetical protein